MTTNRVESLIKPSKEEIEEDASLAIKLREKVTYDYVYIDDKNQVHLFIPLSGGAEIATDNTCQSVTELKKFFGMMKGYPSAADVVAHYIGDLKTDLHYLELIKKDSALFTQKQERLNQLNEYYSLLQTMSLDEEIKKINEEYPIFPPAIKTALIEGENCVVIQLSPEHPDFHLRFGDSLFAAKRKNNRQYEDSFVALLKIKADGIRRELAQFKSDKYKIEEKIALAYKKVEGKDSVSTVADLEVLKSKIIEVLKAEGYEDADKLAFTQVKSNHPVDLEYIRMTSGNEDSPCSIDECCDALIPTPVKDNFIANLVSPLAKLKINNLLEDLSIKIQFFLGIANVHYYQKFNKTCNFGELIEEKSFFRFISKKKDFVDRIIKAIKNNANIENTILDFLNNTLKDNKFSESDREIISRKFRTQYNIIKDSPHFDEFLLFLPEKKGIFYNHQYRIVVPVAYYCKKANPQLFQKFFKEGALASQIVRDELVAMLPSTNENKIGDRITTVPDLEKLSTKEVAFLLSTNTLWDGKEVRAFTTLRERDITQLKSRKDWPIIQSQVELSLKFHEVNVFYAKFHLYPSIHINKEIEKAIFSFYGLSNSCGTLANLIPEDRLKEMLSSLLGVEEFLNAFICLLPHKEGGFVAEFKAKKYIKYINDILNCTKNLLHLNREMALGLYEKAKAMDFKDDSLTSNACNSEKKPYTDSNTPIIKILKILFPHLEIKTEEQVLEHALLAGDYIPSNKEIYVGFNHSNGFVIRSTPEILEQIRDFSSYLNKTTLDISFENLITNCYKKSYKDINFETAVFDGQKRLEKHLLPNLGDWALQISTSQAGVVSIHVNGHDSVRFILTTKGWETYQEENQFSAKAPRIYVNQEMVAFYKESLINLAEEVIRIDPAKQITPASKKEPQLLNKISIETIMPKQALEKMQGPSQFVNFHQKAPVVELDPLEEKLRSLNQLGPDNSAGLLHYLRSNPVMADRILNKLSVAMIDSLKANPNTLTANSFLFTVGSRWELYLWVANNNISEVHAQQLEEDSIEFKIRKNFLSENYHISLANIQTKMTNLQRYFVNNAYYSFLRKNILKVTKQEIDRLNRVEAREKAAIFQNQYDTIADLIISDVIEKAHSGNLDNNHLTLHLRLKNELISTCSRKELDYTRKKAQMFFKGLLGVLLAVPTLGLACASSQYRNYFFHSRSYESVKIMKKNLKKKYGLAQ